MSFIIAIANQKGGIGKTTTAVNLTICLNKVGRKTLLIDLDQQANSTDTMKGKIENTSTIYDVLFSNAAIQESVQKTEHGDLIAGDPLLSQADQKLTELGREHKLRKAINEIKDEYDYIILDTPPGLGIMLINALTCANAVIIPVVPDHYTIKGLQMFFETLASIKEVTNPNIKPLGILLVMVEERTNISKELTENLPEVAKIKWNTKVFNTTIHRSVAVRYSQIQQTGVIDYDPSNTVAIDYALFTKELLSEVENG